MRKRREEEFQNALEGKKRERGKIGKLAGLLGECNRSLAPVWCREFQEGPIVAPDRKGVGDERLATS